MRLQSFTSLLPALFLMAPAALAQTPAAPAPATQAAPAAVTPAVITAAKIAWFDLERAILECEEGKKEFSEMQKFVDKKSGELDAMNKELDTLRNQLTIQSGKLNEDARNDLVDQIATKETTMQRFREDTQRDIDSRRNRLTSNIARKMSPIVEQISLEKGLSAVLFLNPNRDGWVDPNLIITDEIIQAYNVKHPVTATAARP